VLAYRGYFQLVGLLFVAACSDWQEISRARGPDGRIDAVLEEDPGNATTSFYYRVLLLPANAVRSKVRSTEVATLYAARTSDTTVGVLLKWSEPDTLVVEYYFAQEADLVDSVPTVNGSRFHVVLKRTGSVPPFR
jgi:hypothetical protein